jgi:hypothetical protein
VVVRAWMGVWVCSWLSERGWLVSFVCVCLCLCEWVGEWNEWVWVSGCGWVSGLEWVGVSGWVEWVSGVGEWSEWVEWVSGVGELSGWVVWVSGVGREDSHFCSNEGLAFYCTENWLLSASHLLITWHIKINSNTANIWSILRSSQNFCR